AITLAIMAPDGLGDIELVREIAGRVQRLILVTKPAEALGAPEELPFEAEARLIQPLTEQETVACVNAALAAVTQQPGGAEVLQFGMFTLDAAARSCRNATGENVPLTRAEFSLLLALARQPGHVLSRNALSQAAAGRDAEPEDRTVDVLVSRVRRKLEPDP